MLFVGRRALMLSALLAGIGTGLFIDEVGKFLTTSNDYFFAPAAPIIYGGMLLMILVWLVVRRRSANRHDATQALLEAVRNGIDGRLTEHDRRGVVEMWRAHTRTRRRQDAHRRTTAGHAHITGHGRTPCLAGWVASGKARPLEQSFRPAWSAGSSSPLLWRRRRSVRLILLFITPIDLGE